MLVNVCSLNSNVQFSLKEPYLMITDDEERDGNMISLVGEYARYQGLILGITCRGWADSFNIT